MPTYDYECTKCKHKFHLIQPITSKPAARCPKCRSKSERLISGGAGIIFKGSRFYVTEYKRKDEKRKKEGKKEGKKETKKTETKTDKKENKKSDKSD